MTLDTLIMFSGAFVALLPSLGFPASWDNVFLRIVGVLVIALGVVVRRRTSYSSHNSELPENQENHSDSSGQ